MKIRFIATGTAVAALILTGLAVPTAAFAAGTGTLVVQVVQPSGAPLDIAGRGIDAQAKPKGASVWSETALTDAAGRATFTGVPAGVSVSVESNAEDGYIAHFTNGVKVTSGKTTTTKVTAALGATVAGSITVAAAATPLEGGGNVVLMSSSGRVEYSAPISDTGTYSFAGVATGSYRIQFNSRKFATTSDSVLDFTWSYWAGTGKTSTLSWTGAKALKVTQQGAHSAASALTSVNGEVFTSDQISATVTYWSPSSSHHGQVVEFVGAHSADSFTTKLNSMGELDATQINPGKYRVAILGDYDPIFGVQPIYWYVSDNQGPATSESKASWVTVDVAHKHIDFAPKPGNLS